MCAVYGALVWNLHTPADLNRVNAHLEQIAQWSKQRGRDGIGSITHIVDINQKHSLHSKVDPTRIGIGEYSFIGNHLPTGTPVRNGTVIGNLRAEPTTEFVKAKRPHDQQPYSLREWSIVHNGTIANDAELRTHLHPTKVDSAAIVEVLDKGLDPAEHGDDPFSMFYLMLKKLVGSYAILATNRNHPDRVFVGVNYRPVWYTVTPNAVYFASARDCLPVGCVPQMVEPYHAVAFQVHEGRLLITPVPLIKRKERGTRALVVCSGGLDSVVAATHMIHHGYEVELLHLRYGCRAQDNEVRAIAEVSEELNVPFTILDLPFYDAEDSRLLDADAKFAGGEAGAEYAHEWVPARNLLLLSVAVARAEAKGFDLVVLGNNLEEAGAYPDNEPEFINRFNDMMPFAVGDGKHIRIMMPVGNLVKHEIVKLGHDIGAPMHATWSCYRGGRLHCGTCGPCFMRRTAFAINGLPEVIEYEDKTHVSLYENVQP